MIHQLMTGPRAVWATITELLFLLTPLLLIFLLLALQGKMLISNIFGLSDLSLLSTFVFGQAAIKAFQFPADSFTLKGNEIIVGIVALVFCFGVLPSAVIFSLTFISENKPIIIFWLQPVLLVASILIYLLFAYISNAANIVKLEASRTIMVNTLDKLSVGRN
jgi:hypothetical protein